VVWSKAPILLSVSTVQAPNEGDLLKINHIPLSDLFVSVGSSPLLPFQMSFSSSRAFFFVFLFSISSSPFSYRCTLFPSFYHRYSQILSFYVSQTTIPLARLRSTFTRHNRSNILCVRLCLSHHLFIYFLLCILCADDACHCAVLLQLMQSKVMGFQVTSRSLVVSLPCNNQYLCAGCDFTSTVGSVALPPPVKSQPSR